ncbi:response regulator transcription factor [Phenylobacterium sp.]|uniref:response regulator transcription factor n=1 Tax=Phenylobacterium sp. TaxID=1871053 RepID=UPI0025F79A1A|nr:response regulator transcription factor [Phenylobacterium sp.]
MHDDGDRPRLLFVGHDRDDRTRLTERLSGAGYQVRTADSAAAMHLALRRHRCDLVILDVALPGEDGLQLCRDLRADSDLPLILLTVGEDAVDRIVGLEMGADDCLSGPFEPQELLARIKSVLRRVRRRAPATAPLDARLVRFAGWTLDWGSRRLHRANGREAGLSALQLQLLRTLVERRNRIVTRKELIASGGLLEAATPRAVDVQIARLRNKLGAKTIRTVRGEGYALAVPLRFEWSEPPRDLSPPKTAPDSLPCA